MASVENWKEEMQSAYLYRIMAEEEPQRRRKTLFLGLAGEAERQAGIWAQRIAADGGRVPEHYRPDLRVRLVSRLLRYFGPRALRPVLAAMKVRGLSVYRGDMVAGHPMPTSVDEVGHRHRGVEGGGNLRAAVFGVNDGLVSTASLVLGVAGAGAESGVVLLSGAAGLLAGALSMAAGEYVSMRTQREMFEYQIGLEREELALYPDEEAEELALIYNTRGLPLEDARRLSREMLKDPAHALDTLAREELGLNPDDLGSPVGAAVASFLAFAGGGLVPLLPFLLGLGERALPVVWAVTGVALFAVGAVLSLYTGRRAGWSGLRMVMIGGGAGLATYLLGSLLGGALT